MSSTSTDAAVSAFIARWSDTELAERANKDLFLTELCDLLGLPHPDPSGPDSAENAYVFERAVPLHHPDGRTTVGKIDLYRRDRFVLEAKQTAASARPENQESGDAELELGLKLTAPARRAADPYGKAMLEARVQAERYARNLPASEPPPPFVLVLDVGHSLEVYADFTQKGKAFLPFPDARSHRLLLSDLRDEKIRERLRAIWLDPAALDPAKVSAAVTREAARHLAELAKSFEADRHEPRLVAAFLTRCLFCMFAEDIGLLPADGFRTLLESLRTTPEGVAPKLEVLFRELNSGTPFSTVLNVRLLHFNGGLFADASALRVNGTQLGLLIKASALKWRDVEPAIFGTLLERALDPAERHKLGAHYTPRAYVERLVLPTVIEPLRAEWLNVQAAALSHADAGRTALAQEEIFKFHRRLCSLRVLDPACGSGNFLYVTLAHFKVLEGEVLDAYERFGGARRTERGPRGIGAETVDPHQFLGLEINPRASAIAELVLWIGYLQWHFRTFGAVAPAEPVLKNFHNIEHRDAVLAYDGPPEIVTWQLAAADPDAIPGLPPELARDKKRLQAEAEKNPLAPVTLWDRRSFKTDFTTGREVPDETKRVPLYRYENPRPAEWPACDYVVGNPPFLGDKVMKQSLGEGYVETLRATYPEVPESADFVIYWWHKAASLTRTGRLRRFGLITTNSLRQTFNRRIVASHVRPEGPPPALALRFAIPDHPWVDTADGAAVRIAMTVGEIAASNQLGELALVIAENDAEGDEGEVGVTLQRTRGAISPDLTIGADVTTAKTLQANRDVSINGMMLAGRGFVLTGGEAATIRSKDKCASTILKPLRNGRDLADAPRALWVIDAFGFTPETLRRDCPTVYEHLLRTVKPERDANARPKLKRDWWLFGEPRKTLRAGLVGLSRYIATVETSKHRYFQFLDSSIVPEHKLVVVAVSDAFILGVLGSRIHVTYALRSGSTLEDRPVYPASVCFQTFPFPDCPEPQKEKIRALAEELDAHRKRAQEKHGLGLTAIYNVLEKVRANQPLTAKEQLIHDQALVSTLRHLHDQIDAAVAAAYGWPWPLTDEEILARVVALNAERAAEEAQGKIRWLRPEFQAPQQTALGLPSATSPSSGARKKPSAAAPKPKKSRAKTPWPAQRAAQVEAVQAALAAAGKPATAKDLAATFARADAKAVAEILSALVTLGRVRRGEARGTYLA